MPLDKSYGTAVKKPITPALSSRFRNARAPLAPRLAGSVAVSPSIPASKNDKSATIASAVDELAVTSLGDNVTPRSGARSSRVGTDSPGTPGPLRRPSMNRASIPTSTLNSPATNSLNPRSAAPMANGAQGQIVRRISGGSAVLNSDEDDTKFFYAGDLRPATISSKLTTTSHNSAVSSIAQKREATTGSGAISPASSDGRSTSGKDERFFRANELSSSQTPRARPAMVKQTSSASVSSFRTKSPVISRQNSALSPRMSPKRNTNHTPSRPGSPIKNSIFSETAVTPSVNSVDRRNSIGSNSAVSRPGAGMGHKKSASISTVTRSNNLTSPTLARLHMPEALPNASGNSDLHQPFHPVLASPDTMSPRSVSLTSSKTMDTATTTETEMSDLARIILAARLSQSESIKESPVPDLPPKPSPLSRAQVDAANARRERKVLDLEISNSSLLAINKTLERELRKQSAEIRRFRRLSRNGRLSFAPSNRSISAQSMLSSLSEQPYEDDQDPDSSDLEDDDVSDLSDPNEEDLSDTDSVTARSRRRAREERRLMLDLSKHQQLLIDSQKLSQSIRKCTSLTDDLIQEAKKALEYKVGIGDVKLGGRVLNHDELELDVDTSNNINDGDQRNNHEDTETHPQPRRGLLSPSLTQTELQEANMWFTTSNNSEDSRTMPILPPAQLSPTLEKFQQLRIAQDEPG